VLCSEVEQKAKEIMPKTQLNHIEMVRRLHIANERIGSDTLGYIMAGAFLVSAGPWTARALADYLQYPRTTVLRRLRANADRGYVSQKPNGWHATERGLIIAATLIDETQDIIFGLRSDFSAEMLDHCHRMGLIPSPEVAQKLHGFPPIPRT
jgi:hypothetical protein